MIVRVVTPCGTDIIEIKLLPNSEFKNCINHEDNGTFNPNPVQSFHTVHSGISIFQANARYTLNTYFIKLLLHVSVFDVCATVHP